MATDVFMGYTQLGWQRSVPVQGRFSSGQQRQAQLTAQANTAYNRQSSDRLLQLFNQFVERTDDAALASRYGGGPW